jgi:hypothetical protein
LRSSSQSNILTRAEAMSVSETNVIDIIGIDRKTEDVVLTISDHLDWSDSIAHQQTLQKKLDRYLAFVQSGEIMESYPDAKNRRIAFLVIFKFPPDAAGQSFLTNVKTAIRSAGFGWSHEVFGASGNKEVGARYPAAGPRKRNYSPAE